MDIKKELSKLIKKQNIILTETGNKAILYSLKIVKSLGYKKLLIQDQGGWITYKQYAQKLKFETIELETDYGILNEETLKKYNNCILLINSMPGYAYLQEMQEIEKYCKEKKIFLINDISGSVGQNACQFGDIVVCSLGKDKPLGIGKGGFIGYDSEKIREEFYKNNINEESKINTEALFNKISNLQESIKKFESINKKIKNDLKDYKIINKHLNGYNVIVLFKTPREKENLINYCNKNNYEYTICPRYIRVMDQAISIEVKRI